MDQITVNRLKNLKIKYEPECFIIPGVSGSFARGGNRPKLQKKINTRGIIGFRNRMVHDYEGRDAIN